MEKTMSMSISPTHAALVSAAGSNPNSIAPSQNSSSMDSSLAAGGLTLTAVNSAGGAAALPASAWKALALNLKLGTDAQDVGLALVSSMQSLILQRPDLANAQFDFHSENGSIKVTSNTLSNSDKGWLQDLLNSNSGLVQAVQTFHDDAVASFSAAVDASGTQTTQAQTDAVSKKANVSFMQLFKGMGADASQTLDSRHTFYASNGARIDVSQDPSSAVGLLSFMQGAQSLAQGTAKDMDPSGRAYYGTRMNIFENSNSLPNFLSLDSASLGMHVIA
jgi:hypothetical protein